MIGREIPELAIELAIIQRINVVILVIAIVRIRHQRRMHGYLVGVCNRSRTRRIRIAQKLVPTCRRPICRRHGYRHVALENRHARPSRRPVIVEREDQRMRHHHAIRWQIIRCLQLARKIRQVGGQLEVELIVTVQVKILLVEVGITETHRHRRAGGDRRVGIRAKDGGVILEALGRPHNDLSAVVHVTGVEPLVAVHIRIAQLAVRTDVQRELQRIRRRRLALALNRQGVDVSAQIVALLMRTVQERDVQGLGVQPARLVNSRQRIVLIHAEQHRQVPLALRPRRPDKLERVHVRVVRQTQVHHVVHSQQRATSNRDQIDIARVQAQVRFVVRREVPERTVLLAQVQRIHVVVVALHTRVGLQGRMHLRLAHVRQRHRSQRRVLHA